MIEPFSPGNRSRTLLLLTAVAALAVAAAAVGIDDNPIGISLAMLSATALILAFAHPWRASARFRRLTIASALGFVVLLILGVALEAWVDLTSMPGLVDQLLGAIGTAFLLGAAFLCIPGFLVGVCGTILMRRRERDRRPTA